MKNQKVQQVKLALSVVFLLIAMLTGCSNGRCEQLSKVQCADSPVGSAVCAATAFYHCATGSSNKSECRRAARVYCRDYVGEAGMDFFGGEAACEARCESGCLTSHGC
jgi:hypothetical protein